MKTIRLLKWALPAGALVAGGLWFWLDRPVSVSGGPSDAPRSRLTTWWSRSGTCDFSPGDHAAWDLHTHATATLDLATLGLPVGTTVPATEVDLTATLDTEVLRTDAEGAVLLGRLHGLDAETQARTGDVSSSFLFRAGHDCGLKGFARRNGVALSPARTQQATLYELWWKVPAEETETAQGSNGAGSFAAVIARGSDATGSFAQRRITHYTSSYTGSTQGTEVRDSQLTVRYGAGPWFDSIEGREKLGAGAIASSTLTVAASRRAATAGVLADASRNETDYTWEDLLPRKLSPAETRVATFTETERRELAALAEVPFTQAFADFRALVATEPNIDTQWRRMSHWLEANPEQIPTFAGALLTPEFPEKLQGVAFMALGKARVPEARDVLMKIRANPDLEPYDRVRSSLALVGREDVGVGLAKTLRTDALSMTDGNASSGQALYARNALLHLGMMAGLRAGKDQPVVDEARGAVVEMLKAGTSASALSPAFGAIGNMGDPTTLPIIGEWSHHADPGIRAAAVHGFRRLTLEQSGQFSLEWLRRETSPAVKQELYEVIYHQHLDERAQASVGLVQQALRDLAASPQLLTRQSIVRILGPVEATFPEVRAALARQAAKEVGTGSGLYDTISQYVPGDEIQRALVDAQRVAQSTPPAPGTTLPDTTANQVTP